jgi:hypothetical protein
MVKSSASPASGFDGRVRPRARVFSILRTLRQWTRRRRALTSPQFAVLLVLDDHGSLDQSALGALVAIDRSTLTALLDRLEGAWLGDQGDGCGESQAPHRRTHRYRPTPSRCGGGGGGQLLARVEDLLGERRLRQLVELLRVLGDMSGHPSPGGPGTGQQDSGRRSR